MSWPKAQEQYNHLAVQLFELIGGRRDVFPEYYQFNDRDTGKLVKGWGPVKARRIAKDYELQENEQETWNKRTGDRFLCKHFSEFELVKHLRGQKRFGVYPINTEEAVRFLATDFDDHEGTLNPDEVWAEVLNFWEVCQTQGFRAHIERSKSGTGYHVWIFFDGDVSAQKVRGIGRWLMEEAGSLREDDDFSTFDRFFPSQAFLAPGKVGNLIGLPMSGEQDYAKGLCAWVDPNSSNTIEDGPGYLAAILTNGRVPAGFADEFIDEDPDSIKLEGRDSVKLQQKKERDPDAKLGTATEADQVFARCTFMNWASDPEHQDKLKEPQWFNMLTNGARFDIDERLHDSSSAHNSYNVGECQSKIDHARQQGPASCDVIRREGFAGCPAGGCKLPNGKTVKSPAGLSAWTVQERRSESHDPMGGDYPEEDIPPEPSAHSTEEPKATETQEEEKSLWRDDIPLDPDSGMPWPDVEGGWEISTEGVFAPATPIKDKTGNIVDWRQGDLIAVRPIWVDAKAQDNFGAWFVVFKFFDPDWKLITAALPDAALSDSAGKLAMNLREQGAGFLSGKERMMCRLFDVMGNNRTKRSLISNKLGWYTRRNQCAFVLPDRIIGARDKDIIFPKSLQQDMQCIRMEGGLDQWQQHVADPSSGNPILMFAILTALAGPVLEFSGGESGGFHFYGTTSTGKTTLLQVAASVWGEGSDPQGGGEHAFTRKWYATGNALEATAQLHHNLVLCMDEISQVESSELGDLIYMLAGGQPKGRSQADGGLRRQQTWQLFFLSNGEKTITQIMSQAGKAVKGGQRHRMPDIPIQTSEGKPLLISNAHGKTYGKFARDLKKAASNYFGSAGPTLTSWMAAEVAKHGREAFCDKVNSYIETLEDNLTADVDLPPDGERVTTRLASAAVAGMLAGEAGVIKWSPQEIHEAVVHVRNLWLEAMGDEISEEDRALAHLRKMILGQMHRFRDVDMKGEIPECLGFRSDDYIMPLKDMAHDLTGEFDTTTVMRELRNRGLLWNESGRLTRRAPVLQGRKERPPCYFIKREFLGSTEDDPAPENTFDNFGNQSSF